MYESDKVELAGKQKNNRYFLDSAIHLGERLSKEAIWHDGRCTWTGDDVSLINGDWKVVHQTVDPYLYSGTAGIAWFLTLCRQPIGDVQLRETLRKTAIGAVRQSSYLAKQIPEDRRPLGLYDGLTGIALIAAELGNQLQAPELTAMSLQLTAEICKRIGLWRVPHTADLVSGLAGILLGLIQLARTAKNPSLYTQCDILCEQLLAQAHRTDYGFYWAEAELQGSHPGLCGMGHGASGIAQALIEYSQIAENKDYMEAALQAIVYERSWFHRGESNWPDIRDMQSEGEEQIKQELVYPVYWCHGAAGIGLVRLRAYQLSGDKFFLADTGAALQAATRHAKQLISEARRTRRITKDINLSVCHGLGSIIALFVYAYQVLGRPEFLKRALDIGAFAIKISTNTRRSEYWRCGIHDGGEAPGLMLGVAGIGCNFLQLHNPSTSHPVGLVPGLIASHSPVTETEKNTYSMQYSRKTADELDDVIKDR